MNPASVDHALLRAVVTGMPDGPLADVRNAAAAQFASMGFPKVGEEDWKYTNLASAVDISNGWLESQPANQSEFQRSSIASARLAAIQEQIDAHWILIEDGAIDDASLEATKKAIGVGFERLGKKTDDIIVTGSDAMSVFNAALLRDGLRIDVPPNAMHDKPVGLLFVDSSSTRVSQTRVVIRVAENSQLRVVECVQSLDHDEQFTNSVVQVELADGGKLDHVRIQKRSENHIGVNRIHTNLDRNSRFNQNSFDFGGSLTRNDIVASIDGEGASVRLHGLYLAAGNQHIDNHTTVMHRVGPATSVEEYRGIVGGRSRCVFNGKAIVSKGADGTDATQSNHNLLLSDHAEINTKPELEIYADEVKCSHGATVGQLDADALFYLQSRGLDPEDSKRLLTSAFAASTLKELTIEACREFLTGVLERRLTTVVEANEGQGQ